MRIPRIYNSILANHYVENRQIALLVGPRQVGKTSICKPLGVYLDFDNLDHRRLIVKGPEAVAEFLGLNQLRETKAVVIFDKLHKHAKWKSFLKGFFDTYEERVQVAVTGSSRLDVWRKGGDSLMGRYFLYHVHPFSVGELIRPKVNAEKLFASPEALPIADWNALQEFGGFPEPFVKRDIRFANRWKTLRKQQLLREDVRELARIHELSHLELLTQLLAERSGGQLVHSHLAQDLQVSTDTIRRWVELLCNLHYGFVVRPWFKSVAKAIRKEPKWFLRDWSEVKDEGARFETLIACHLIKAVETWNDLGMGIFELRYVRDKNRREVDFLLVQDQKPWILVEAKLSDTSLSPSLRYFKELLKAPHAFQVVCNEPFVKADPFLLKDCVIVPAQTFLSMLP